MNGRNTNVNHALMIKVQYWVLKYSNVVDSPIISETILVKDEDTGNFLFVSIFSTFILLTGILLLFY